MTSLANNLYRFGGFTLDARGRVLTRGEEVVALTPKAFDVLLLLVQNAGGTVAKDELLKAVWRDSFVEESNLTQTIFMVRKALDETADRRYILTAQGQGYRFLLAVAEAARGGAETKAAIVPPAANAPTAKGPDAKDGRETRLQSNGLGLGGWRGPVRVVAVAVLAFVLIAAFVFWPLSSRRGTAQQPGRIMLAFLPFQNLT